MPLLGPAYPNGHRLFTRDGLREFAGPLLEPLGARWQHTQAVGTKAESLAARLDLEPFDRDRLVNAAWLHDIGYAFPHIHRWHPHAGAVFLFGEEMYGIAHLVAWHSTAQREAEILGYMSLLSRWAHEVGVVQDALDWCDMTTGPTGEDLTISGRLKEVGDRHGTTSSAYRAMAADQPRLLAIDRAMRALN